MQPEYIKAELRIRGVPASAIAARLKVTRVAVSNVIHGTSKSRRIADEISDVLDKPVSQIWPGSYDERRKRRNHAGNSLGPQKVAVSG